MEERIMEDILHISFELRKKFSRKFAKEVLKVFSGCEFSTFYDFSWKDKEFPNKLLNLSYNEITYLHKFNYLASSNKSKKEKVNEEKIEGHFPFNETIYIRKEDKVFIVNFIKYTVGRISFLGEMDDNIKLEEKGK